MWTGLLTRPARLPHSDSGAGGAAGTLVLAGDPAFSPQTCWACPLCLGSRAWLHMGRKRSSHSTGRAALPQASDQMGGRGRGWGEPRGAEAG